MPKCQRKTTERKQRNQTEIEKYTKSCECRAPCLCVGASTHNSTLNFLYGCIVAVVDDVESFSMAMSMSNRGDIFQAFGLIGWCTKRFDHTCHAHTHTYKMLMQYYTIQYSEWVKSIQLPLPRRFWLPRVRYDAERFDEFKLSARHIFHFLPKSKTIYKQQSLTTRTVTRTFTQTIRRTFFRGRENSVICVALSYRIR